MAKYYFIGLALIISTEAVALPEDRDRPIKITANNAVINEKQNEAEYKGSVVVTQGTLKLKGDSVTLKTNEAGEVETFLSRGSPARFENLRRKTDQEPIRGNAKTIYYSYDSNRIVLKGGAEIQTKDTQFSGPKITYDPTTGKVTAAGSRSKRIIMMMQPKKND